MKKSRVISGWLGLVIAALGSGPSSAAELLIQTGFEPEQGYALADLHGQLGWSVEGGSAEVWSQTVYAGKQAARIAPWGSIRRGIAAAASVVTLRSFLQAEPTMAPDIPSVGQAVVLYLDADYGLTGLDGDGQGGGHWVGSGITIPTGTWFELTVQVNFEAKTWECAVNGRPALSGLRFHSNDVVGFGSVDLAASERDVVLDQLTVSGVNPPPSEGTDLVAAVPFAMGFEPQEGYALGDLDAQKGWEVDAGQAEVWTQTVYSGVQAARIAPGGRVSHRFATGFSKTTFSTYLQATPSAAPEIPSAGQAAVLYLDPVLGLTCLDGDGNGGGRWVGSGVIVPAGVWFQLTLNLDFESKTWECLVNGQPALSGLHFHANHVTAFGSVAAASDSGDTLLDSARVDASIAPSVPSHPPGPVSTFPFGWGFETAEGYLLGDLEGQQGWTVDAGRGEVWTQTVYSGAQAARVEPGGQVSRRFATGLPLITFRSYVQATPTPTPDIPSAAQASVLYLDPDYGLTGLDGDGVGGGHWVGSGVVIQPGTWFELTVRLDIHRKTWDCLVDGRLALAGLRFHSDDVVAFGSVVAAAELGDTLLDAMSIRVADTPISPEFPALTSSHHGFEPEEGYFLGDLDQQQGWTVRDGDSQVWSNAVHSGVQAARIEPGSRIFQNVAMASPIVIFDGYLRASPSAAPEIPDTAQIAVVYLDAVNGITGLDGDGNGGGRWVGSGVTVPANAWFRATIRVDFATKTWSCAINGALALTNLRFHADGIATFSTFAAGASSGGDTLLDEVRFVAEEGMIIAPALTIGIAGRDLEISWPADVAGYRLQVSPSLEKPTWVDVVTTGNRVIEKPDQATQFYRLIAP